MRADLVALGVIFALASACSPEPLPAASDAGELVDESVTGVTDAVADSAVDAANGDAADFDASPDVDVPYWIAHDIDIAGLGVLTKTGECSDPEMKVQPGDPPKGPACGSQCPPPYACTCGACPWIQTPKMVHPREQAAAVWTGKEVLVFGGANSPCCGDGNTWPFTAERWNPYDGKGFVPIDLPFQVSVTDVPVAYYKYPPWIRAVWTGKVAVVLGPQLFTFDPATSKLTLLDDPGILLGETVVVSDRLIWWGIENPTLTKQYKTRIRALDFKTMKWSEVPFPSQFYLDGTQSVSTAPGCMTADESNLYVLDPRYKLNPAAGLSENGVLFAYNVESKSWSAVADLPSGAPRCGKSMLGFGGVIYFGHFPGGISIYGATTCTSDDTKFYCKYGGSTWWQATGKWTAVTAGPATGTAREQVNSLWTGSQFVVMDPYVTDPISPVIGGGASPQPVLYDPYADAWSYTTSIGAFKRQRTDGILLHTGKELLVIGGQGGGSFAAITEADGARLWLPANPTTTDFSGAFP